ncbi:hemolysin family protein [Luteipulveratus halotolerans]|uniref:Membrane protein n=1 Tax=Luteipulveratus halotolerans TaxID=1631356 RepID=A0A0L6CI43_9MICO|nr:hemolysin family protein [Luteipulveratus halotolerans]KNX37452.1 membrane protein [Luteipulveratus halotolerans]
MTGLWIAALLSVVVGFVLALIESALSRLGPHSADDLVDEGRRGASTLQVLLHDRGAVLMVLTFLRVLSEATAAVLATLAVDRVVDGFWATLLIAIAVMAVISFVLVGVSPRTLGRQHASTVALASAPLVRWLRTVLAPVVRLVVLLGNAVTPGRGYRDGPFESEAELREFVDMAQESELIEADERKMIHSVFELGDTVAREVMVPRTDMITIDRSKTLRQAMVLFSRSGFSRLPVVDGSPDEVDGLLFFKDVSRRVFTDPDSDGLPVHEAMRPIAYVPDSKPADDLLRQMQVERRHFAIVIDEYGGTAGLVTMEDIVEEIVGEIDDEYDRATPGVEEMDDGRTRVPARMHVDALAELFDVTLEDDDVDTVGGLLTKLVGRVPIPGATGSIAGLRLTAERMAGRRHQLATVVVERVPAQDVDNEPTPVGDQPDVGEEKVL